MVKDFQKQLRQLVTSATIVKTKSRKPRSSVRGPAMAASPKPGSAVKPKPPTKKTSKRKQEPKGLGPAATSAASDWRKTETKLKPAILAVIARTKQAREAIDAYIADAPADPELDKLPSFVMTPRAGDERTCDCCEGFCQNLVSVKVRVTSSGEMIRKKRCGCKHKQKSANKADRLGKIKQLAETTLRLPSDAHRGVHDPSVGAEV